MLNPGDRFGDYRVLRLLGKGGMGSVFLLENAEGVQIAAKILDPATASDHEARKRFLREAQLALGVKHPNLVETYDVGEDPETGFCYILMEYVSGGSLADYLKENGALPIEDAVAVVQAMASVLELARQKGVVHRDIKPGNIMFDAEGTPKLADLGIARGGLAGTETTTVTQTGMMIGTPAYMAPEQMLDAHHVDTRADIYSLGVVFFEMLTGERPNKDDTVVQLMAKAVKGQPLPDVRTLRPEVSASLAQLLNMMVAPDKDGRISTPGQITSALDIIARGGTFAAKPAAATRNGRGREATDPVGRRFPWRLFFPVVILAGLAVVFGYFATQVRKSRSMTHVRVVEKEKIVEKVIKPDSQVITNTLIKEVVRERVRTNVVERKFASEGSKPADLSPGQMTQKSKKSVKVNVEKLGFSWGVPAGRELFNAPTVNGVSTALPATEAKIAKLKPLVSKIQTKYELLLEDRRVSSGLSTEWNEFLACLREHRHLQTSKTGKWALTPAEREEEERGARNRELILLELIRLQTKSASVKRSVENYIRSHRGEFESYDACVCLARQLADGEVTEVSPIPAERKKSAVEEMSGPEPGWLVGEDSPRPLPAVRICIDQSHGGDINEGCAFYLPFLEKEDGFAHKACWHGLESENLRMVNVLVLPPSWDNVPYLQGERAVIRSFLESGGTAISIVDGNLANLSMSRELLAEYGLEISGGNSADENVMDKPARSKVSAFSDIRNVKFSASSTAIPRTKKDADIWSAMLESPVDGSVLMATRSVGKGRLVFASAGLRFNKEKMSDYQGNCRLWKRLFCSAARAKRLSPSSDIDARAVTEAPVRIKVGPFVLHSAERWRNETQTIAKYMKKALSAVEDMGVPTLERENVKYSNVVIIGAGGMHWYWSGDRSHRIGVHWGGNPQSPGSIIQVIIENMLHGTVNVPDEIPLRDYLALRCLSEFGLANEANGMMNGWSGRWAKTAAYCRALDSIRKDCSNFPKDFCRTWCRMPAQASAKDFFMTLSRAIGHDCRPYFKTQGIEAFGLGGETCEIAGDGKLVFSDREMEKMKGLSGEKAVQKAFNRLFPGWKVSSCSGVSDEGWNRIGYLPEISERRNICCTLPKSSREPARFVRNVKVPENGAVLCFSARKTIYANAGFMVEIAVGGKVMREVRVDDDDWVDEEFDLAPWSGKTVKVEVRHREIPGLKNARASWSRLEIR